ncbi:MAG: hypothetical protein ACLR17_06215 [Enterobacteriaceae bacterium]
MRLSGHRPADSGGLVARSAQRHREESTPIHHSGTFPAGGAAPCPGTGPQTAVDCSPVSAAPPGINHRLQQGQQKYDFAQLNRRA